MKLSNLLLLSLAIVMFMSCSENSTDDTGTKNSTLSELKTSLIESNNSFAFDIFNEIVQNEEADANVFISPLSMYYALAMAANGANGETFGEFVELLGWSDVEKAEILESMKELSEQILPDGDDVTVEVANSMWPELNFPIKEDYVTEVQNYFDAEVKPLDFTDLAAVDVINGWIEDKTHDKIKDMLDLIPSDAVLYLINAIYFKGTWRYEFSDTSNYEASFNCRNGNQPEVTYMIQKADLNWYSDDEIIAVQLPYLDSNYCMTIVVPQGSLSNDFYELGKDKWNSISENFSEREVTISLPKFKFEFGTRNINDELKALGLNLAFDYVNADFTGIYESDFYNIYISRVLHKAFIEVNEEGSEAAAATIVEIVSTTSEIPGSSVTLDVNRPFIFAISEEQTQNIMFIGRVELPEYE